MSDVITSSVAVKAILGLLPEVVRLWFAPGRPKCVSKHSEVVDEGMLRFRITNRGRNISRFCVKIHTTLRKDGFESEPEWHDADSFETRHKRAFKVRAAHLFPDGKLPDRVWFSYTYVGRTEALNRKPSFGSKRRMRKLLPAALEHIELSKQRAAQNSAVARWMRGEDVDFGGRSRSPLER